MGQIWGLCGFDIRKFFQLNFSFSSFSCIFVPAIYVLVNMGIYLYCFTYSSL